MKHFLDYRRASSGLAAVEFAIILPVLGMLAFPVFDYARAIQASTILINISREGANQASRTPDLDPSKSQTIMEALASTTPPMVMNTNGVIYITEIFGGAPGTQNKVRRQYRWSKSENAHLASIPSKIANCSSYGSENMCDFPNTTTDVMDGALLEGETVFAVEARYHQPDSFINLKVFKVEIAPQDLYAITIF